MIGTRTISLYTTTEMIEIGMVFLATMS